MWTPKLESFKERVAGKIADNHFMHDIDFEIKEIEAGYIMGELQIKKKHTQQIGLLHGGVTATLADIVAGFAAFTLVDNKTHVVTGEIKVSYLSKGRGNLVRAVGKVIKAGRKLSFCESEIYIIDGENEKLIAKSSSTMINIPE